MPSATPRRLSVDPPTAESVNRAFKLEGFFPEFDEELCGKVFPRSGIEQFRPGENLIEQGESGRDLFLLLAGEVVVQFTADHLAAEAGRLGPGALVGEMALLADGVRSATVTASVPVFAFRLVYEDVGYILKNNPELAEHLKELARTRAAR
jgi:CRP-like cAMP-binding protein